jgi:transposase InsO family protein
VVNHERVVRVMTMIGLAWPGLVWPGLVWPGLAAAASPHHYRRFRRGQGPGPARTGVHATTPDTKYVGDITYLPTTDGTCCYLATVMDLCSRRLVGCAVADHMCTELGFEALHAAQRSRGSLVGVIFHSDHGAQHSARAFTDACREAGVIQPMGAVGNSTDKAAAESPNASFERETLQGSHNWGSE